MPLKIKIAVNLDHALFRQGLTTLIGSYPDLKLLFETSEEKELLHVLKKQQPHILLLGLPIPDPGGSVIVSNIKTLYPNIRIIIILPAQDEALIFDLVKKGANGFITKQDNMEQVIQAIHTVKEKGFYHTEEVTHAMLSGVRNRQKMRTSLNAADLTERELEIIRLICKQYSLKDIAAELTLSPRTVETHKEHILMKTGAKNIAGIVLYAVEHHLL